LNTFSLVLIKKKQLRKRPEMAGFERDAVGFNVPSFNPSTAVVNTNAPETRGPNLIPEILQNESDIVQVKV
jgi:hypothetical protein